LQRAFGKKAQLLCHGAATPPGIDMQISSPTTVILCESIGLGLRDFGFRILDFKFWIEKGLRDTRSLIFDFGLKNGIHSDAVAYLPTADEINIF
ncbi:MAG: hypothetical protein QNJ58_15155, partial [Desulfobacterales bacterium]|nr:hypothetical protein [Desulfobacterales bacterium]